MVSDLHLISSPVILPNGAVVPNRLVKAAMEEGIGTGGGLPGKHHQRLYSRWAEGGWGMIITGNAQVDERHLATPHDRTIPSTPASLQAWTSLLTSILSHVPAKSPTPICLIQISHAGLQSSSTINFSRAPWSPALGPCSARPDMGSSILGWIAGHLIWPSKSQEIVDSRDWLDIVEMFVASAKVAEEAGWDGVQVHSAHGYLLAEYLSPLTNPLARPLPGVPAHIPNRLHLLYSILRRLHDETDGKFIKAVKINSSDFVQGGLTEEQAAGLIKEIVSWKMVDLLEISGGNYSSPAFCDLEHTPSSSPRQALFSSFTSSLLPSLPAPPEGPAIMLTGGLHSRPLIATSIKQRACDLVGIGRPACLKPTLPKDIIFNNDIADEETDIGTKRIPGAETWKWLLGGGSSSKPTKSTVPPSTYVDASEESTPLVGKSEHDQTKQSGIPLVGAGVSTFWHEWQMCRIGRGVDPDPEMSWGVGLAKEALWWGVAKGGPLGWWNAYSRG